MRSFFLQQQLRFFSLSISDRPARNEHAWFRVFRSPTTLSLVV
jgi:hypothetical protein